MDFLQHETLGNDTAYSAREPFRYKLVAAVAVGSDDRSVRTFGPRHRESLRGSRRRPHAQAGRGVRATLTVLWPMWASRTAAGRPSTTASAAVRRPWRQALKLRGFPCAGAKGAGPGIPQIHGELGSPAGRRSAPADRSWARRSGSSMTRWRPTLEPSPLLTRQDICHCDSRAVGLEGAHIREHKRRDRCCTQRADRASASHASRPQGNLPPARGVPPCRGRIVVEDRNGCAGPQHLNSFRW